MGYLFTFEGGEGSGKTTQIKLLKDSLEKENYIVHVTREPGGTEISEQIRKILLNRKSRKLVPLAELFLYEASRAQLVEEFIRPVLESDRRAIIICDRFYDASTAYQAGARALDEKLVEELNHIATAGLTPDRTFYIDIDPAIGLRRAKRRMRETGSNQDRFERETSVFHDLVREAYLRIAQRSPGRLLIIDGSQSVNEIHQKIMEHVKCFLKG